MWILDFEDTLINLNSEFNSAQLQQQYSLYLGRVASDNTL